MTTFQFLALCSRVGVDDDVAARLRAAASSVDWNAVLIDADAHGIEPLVFAHLMAAGADVPTEARRLLQARAVQHAHAHAVRTRVLNETVAALKSEGIDVLLLKGAALAHLVYPAPRLRPMLDLDVLVRPADAHRAHHLLVARGFSARGAEVAADYHHLTPLATTVDGISIVIEVHRELLRSTPSVRPLRFDDVEARAQVVHAAGHEIRTLGPEDMLWHVYAHAFAINVLRPAFRLVSVADLNALVEVWKDRIDWDWMWAHHGRLMRGLPWLHHLTPWSPGALRVVGAVPRYQAPIQTITLATHWPAVFGREVLWPPDIWFALRYGVRGWPSWAWHRLVTHPSCVLRSARHTAAIRLRKQRPAVDTRTPAVLPFLSGGRLGRHPGPR